LGVRSQCPAPRKRPRSIYIASSNARATTEAM